MPAISLANVSSGGINVFEGGGAIESSGALATVASDSEVQGVSLQEGLADMQDVRPFIEQVEPEVFSEVGRIFRDFEGQGFIVKVGLTEDGTGLYEFSVPDYLDRADESSWWGAVKQGISDFKTQHLNQRVVGTMDEIKGVIRNEFVDFHSVARRDLVEPGIEVVGSAVRLNEVTSGSQSGTQLERIGDNLFAMNWITYGEYDGNDVKGRIFELQDSELKPTGADFRVNQYTNGHQGSQRMASLGNDQFVSVWRGPGLIGSQDGIFLRAFEFKGSQATTIGKEVQISDSGHSVDEPDVMSLGNGYFLVAGHNRHTNKIFTQVYQINQDRVLSVENSLNIASLPPGAKGNLRLENLNDSNHVIIWSVERTAGQGRDIYARLYQSDDIGNTSPLSPAFRANHHVSNHQVNPNVVYLGGDKMGVVWQDGSSPYPAKLQVFTIPEYPVSSSRFAIPQPFGPEILVYKNGHMPSIQPINDSFFMVLARDTSSNKARIHFYETESLKRVGMSDPLGGDSNFEFSSVRDSEFVLTYTNAGDVYAQVLNVSGIDFEKTSSDPELPILPNSTSDPETFSVTVSQPQVTTVKVGTESEGTSPAFTEKPEAQSGSGLGNAGVIAGAVLGVGVIGAGAYLLGKRMRQVPTQVPTQVPSQTRLTEYENSAFINPSFPVGDSAPRLMGSVENKLYDVVSRASGGASDGEIESSAESDLNLAGASVELETLDGEADA